MYKMQREKGKSLSKGTFYYKKIYLNNKFNILFSLKIRDEMFLIDFFLIKLLGCMIFLFFYIIINSHF